MRQNHETDIQTRLFEEKQRLEPRELLKNLGNAAVVLDRSDERYQVPQSYPNDREWAQMNLLA